MNNNSPVGKRRWLQRHWHPVVTVNAATNVTATFTAFTVPNPLVIGSATPGNAQVNVG